MNLVIVVLFFFTTSISGQVNKVLVKHSSEGWKLIVDGKAEFINGMNWNYMPIGETYTYSIWEQSEDFIKKALDYEMGLIQEMGVNSIRVYTGIPQEWITYIYKNYGIYTMLNHSFGRYGVSIDGQWMSQTDYSNRKVQELLLSEVVKLAEDYKETPGLLMYLIGNENNYGLFWEGAETEDIPVEDRKLTKGAIAMYELMNEAAQIIKAIDTNHPVAICNGDLQFLDIISEEVTDADIFGTNSYRGVSFTNLFGRVREEYGKPVLLTEFGSDAFNTKTGKEDEKAQAYYLKGNWKEIYANAAGMGKNNNVIGGYTFQSSDGWWKYDQNDNLDVHDTNASWSNGGYEFDYMENKNNMNEEWFGIMAKGTTDSTGFYELYPRNAYFMLKKIHDFDPYLPGTSKHLLIEYFDKIKK